MSWTTEWPCDHVDRFKTSLQDRSDSDRIPTKRTQYFKSLGHIVGLIYKLHKEKKQTKNFPARFPLKINKCRRRKDYVLGLRAQCQENVRLEEAGGGQRWRRDMPEVYRNSRI